MQNRKNLMFTFVPEDVPAGMQRWKAMNSYLSIHSFSRCAFSLLTVIFVSG